MAALFSFASHKKMPKLGTYRSLEFQVRRRRKKPDGLFSDVRPWPAYGPFFPVESRAKAQREHKKFVPKQVRGTVSLFKYSKVHLQITFVVSQISSLVNCIHQLFKTSLQATPGR